MLDEADEAMLSTDDSKMQEGFVPGLIHFPNKIVFWKNELKASNWVMDTLRQGYMLPLESPPPAEY